MNMLKQLELCKSEVETLRYALLLHLDLLTAEGADRWDTDRFHLQHLIHERFAGIAAGTYSFGLAEIELINRALRHHVRQLYLDLHQALESEAGEPMVYNLYDSQQDAFNLLSRFPYYTADN